MNGGIVRMSIALGVVLSGPPCLAAATPWMDAAISFDRPGGSSDLGGPPGDALGPRDFTLVFLEVPGTLAPPSTDASAGDGLETGPAIFDVYVGGDHLTYAHSGTMSCTFEFDLADYSTLDYVNYLKLADLEDDGEDPGYDLAAVETLHPIVRVKPENDTPIPRAVLLAAVGTGLIGRLRRHRTR